MNNKFHSRYRYNLEFHNEWFFDNIERVDILKISEKRLEQSIKLYNKEDDVKKIYRWLKNIAQLWFEYKIIDWDVYVSWYYLLISQLFWALRLHLWSDKVDLNVIVKLLFWEMSHHYYITSPEWEKLFNTLNYERLHPEEWNILSQYWTIMIAYHLTNATRKKKETQNLEKEANNIIESWKWELTSNHIMHFYNNSYASNEYLKFDKKGLDFIKNWFAENPEILEWFKKIRIKRKTNLNLKLLYAIIASIYLWEQLYLYIDPYYYSAQIATKESLYIDGINPQIIFNFTNFTNIVFNNYDFVKDTKFNPKDKKDISPIKEMFDEIYKQVSEINPDKLKVSINWWISDISKLMQVKKKVPYWEVWTQQHWWKSSEVKFHIEKDLQGFKKKLKKK